MRFLVAAACLAILIVTGYFFWGEYQESQRAERVAVFSQKREVCHGDLDQYAKMSPQSADRQAMRQALDACANSFLISAEDINRAARR